MVGIMPFPKLGVVGTLSVRRYGGPQGGRAGPPPSTTEPVMQPAVSHLSALSDA